MSQQQSDDEINRLWRNLFESERAYIQARVDFLAQPGDRVELIRKALHDPAQRGTALRLLFYLRVAERQQLFAELVNLASVGHADVGLVREVILSLPREWVLAHIEAGSEALLSGGSDEEYRRLLELYVLLDSDLTRRLAERALLSADPDIREAGADALEWLHKPA